MKTTTTICPICGLDNKPDIIYSNGLGDIACICPCCGTQFGYDDGTNVYADQVHVLRVIELRKRWIDTGMKWWSKSTFNPIPNDWHPIEQLKNIPKEFIDEKTRCIIDEYDAKKVNFDKWIMS